MYKSTDTPDQWGQVLVSFHIDTLLFIYDDDDGGGGDSDHTESIILSLFPVRMSGIGILMKAQTERYSSDYNLHCFDHSGRHYKQCALP